MAEVTTPRIVVFAHGELGRHAITLLRSQVVAVVINEGCDYRHGPLMDQPFNVVWLYGDDDHLEERIRLLHPTHGVSVGYRSIIRRPIINAFPNGIANIHTSLLPLCRGAHPNAWTIFLDQPAGVSMHLVDDGVDTGPILAQSKVEKRCDDTAATLQDRLIAGAKELMRVNLHRWIGGELRATPQAECHWPTHRKADLDTIRIDGDKKYHGWEVMNILRARTFPPYAGALYTAPDRKRYRVRVEITPEPEEKA